MPLSRQISCLDLACCVGNKQSAYSVLLLAVIGFLLLHSPRRASTGEVCYRIAGEDIYIQGYTVWLEGCRGPNWLFVGLLETA